MGVDPFSAAVIGVSTVAGIFAGNEAKKAGERQEKAIRNAAEAELEAYRTAQEILGKNKGYVHQF